MTGWTVMRVLALLAMAWGAWSTFRKAPRAFAFEGRKYYSLPDGRFCTRWGRIITDGALHERLMRHRTIAVSAPANEV